jgi:hypothetical protein
MRLFRPQLGILQIPLQTDDGWVLSFSCNRSRPMAKSRQIPEEEPLISANER